MDTSVAFPNSGRCSSMIVSVRVVPKSPPVPRRAASSSLRPVRESDPTSSQFVPEVFAMRSAGRASTRESRASTRKVRASSTTRRAASRRPQPPLRRRLRCGRCRCGRCGRCVTCIGTGSRSGRGCGGLCCTGRCCGGYWRGRYSRGSYSRGWYCRVSCGSRCSGRAVGRSCQAVGRCCSRCGRRFRMGRP